MSMREVGVKQITYKDEAQDALEGLAQGEETKFGREMFAQGFADAHFDKPPGPAPAGGSYGLQMYKAGWALGRGVLGLHLPYGP